MRKLEVSPAQPRVSDIRAGFKAQSAAKGDRKRGAANERSFFLDVVTTMAFAGLLAALARYGIIHYGIDLQSIQFEDVRELLEDLADY